MRNGRWSELSVDRICQEHEVMRDADANETSGELGSTLGGTLVGVSNLRIPWSDPLIESVIFLPLVSVDPEYQDGWCVLAPNDTAYKRWSFTTDSSCCANCVEPSRPRNGCPIYRFWACGPAGWLALLLTKVGDVETNPGLTTLNKQVWICDICHKADKLIWG